MTPERKSTEQYFAEATDVLSRKDEIPRIHEEILKLLTLRAELQVSVLESVFATLTNEKRQQMAEITARYVQTCLAGKMPDREEREVHVALFQDTHPLFRPYLDFYFDLNSELFGGDKVPDFVSRGDHFKQAWMATQLNHAVQTGDIELARKNLYFRADVPTSGRP